MNTNRLSQPPNRTHARPRRWLPALLALASVLLLSGCMTNRSPLRVRNVNITPEPIIGQVATLHFEIVSPKDEPNAELQIRLPEGVKLVSGDLTWQGSLTANQPQAHEISICTQFEGKWWIRVKALAWENEYLGEEIVHLDVTQDSAHFVTNDYEYNQSPSPGPMVLPTSLPTNWLSPCP